jgi:two-component system, NarL family, invasion response regulator UvrY
MTPVILLADDHIMISKGLRKAIELEFGYTEISSVTSCNEVMNELKKKKTSHLILDLGLADGSALEVLPLIRRLYPALHIMIFSGKLGSAYQRGLRQYGIDHFLSKEEDEDKTIVSLRKFFQNERVAPKADTHDNPFSALASREMEVLHYILKGKRNSEICKALNIHFSTVSTFKTRILEKTQTNNLMELTELAMIYNIR